MLLQALGRTQDAENLTTELAEQGFAEPSFTRQLAALVPPD
jgi:hypothetical protein